MTDLSHTLSKLQQSNYCSQRQGHVLLWTELTAAKLTPKKLKTPRLGLKRAFRPLSLEVRVLYTCQQIDLKFLTFL